MPSVAPSLGRPGLADLPSGFFKWVTRSSLYKAISHRTTIQFTLEVACFLTFSIALNLQYNRHCLFHGLLVLTEAGRLVVVHRVNGQRMEKFYVLGSFAISLCLTIPAYATGQYG